MSWTGTPWIGAQSRTAYGGYGKPIFTATQAGDLKKVRNLQKLMLRSRANALLSVRRVTEHTHCQRRLPDGSAGAPVLCSPD